jgi:hypothetical protein
VHRKFDPIRTKKNKKQKTKQKKERRKKEEAEDKFKIVILATKQ